MAGIVISTGTGSSSELAVDTSGNASVRLPQVTTTAGVETPAQVGAVRTFSENDAGTVIGTAHLLSPETSDDYRLRTVIDMVLDRETFIYAAQNTARHIYRNTTMTNVWGSGFLTTNGTSITTINTGTSFATYTTYPIVNAQTLYAEFRMALSATVGVTNTTIDFGFFIPTTGATPWAPTDGAYFRVTSAGIFGVVLSAGSAEVTTAPFWTGWVTNTVYKFVIAVSVGQVEFWINDVLYGRIDTPAGRTAPCLAGSLPLAIRHAIGATAASAAFQAKFASYTVSVGGYGNSGRAEDALAGSGIQAYQGQSGGTMGSTSNLTNSQAFTSAVLSNTATIVTGLGGRFGITIGASANTDGICTSFQNPANSTTYVGRPLRVSGCTVSAAVQAALGATALLLDLYVAYGHTALSLATAEAATTKAPRRVPVGIMAFPASAAAGVAGQPLVVQFSEPIVVMPGEFIQLVAQQPLGVTGTVFVVAQFDAGLM